MHVLVSLLKSAAKSNFQRFENYNLSTTSVFKRKKELIRIDGPKRGSMKIIEQALLHY